MGSLFARPKGIFFIAVYLFFVTFPALLMMMAAGISGPPDKTIQDTLIRSAFLFSPFMCFAGGLGIWRQRVWGKVAALVVFFAMLLGAGAGIFQGDFLSKGFGAFQAFFLFFMVILPLIAVCYLLSPKHKHLFK